MDNVNHPKHYTQGGIECIDALAAATNGLEGIEAVDTANAIKYLWRWKYKNGVEDINKAIWYLNHLKGELSGNPNILNSVQVSSVTAPQSVNWILQKAERLVANNPLQLIERCARICYKSEDKITEDSYNKMVSNLNKNHHYAMFEHAVYHFLVKASYKNWYRKWMFGDARKYCVITPIDIDKHVVTINLRAMLEHSEYFPFYIALQLSGIIKPSYISDLNACYVDEVDEVECVGWDIVYDLLPPEEAKSHKVETIKFVTDIGVANEMVRHRNSFAQESTRYINYDKNGIQFVKPVGYDLWTTNVQREFEECLLNDVKTYNSMIANGRQPQEARDILPKCLKTEIVMTASLDNWDHFLDLRYRELTGKAHPKMKELATKAYEILNDLYPWAIK